MFKKALLLGVLLCTLPYAAYCADVLVEEPLNKFCVATYKCLPSVEAANDGLLALGNTDAFLTDVSDQIAGYDAVNFLGVRLIHQHNPLADGEIMLEEFKYDEGDPAFITSNRSADTKGSIPASWLMTPSGLRVFEYSTDATALSGFEYLTEHPETLRIVTSTLQKYALESYLAPSVVMLDSSRHFDPADHLVETSRTIVRESHEIYENVVKGVPSDIYSTLKVIKTSWQIDAASDGPEWYCHRYCTPAGGMFKHRARHDRKPG